MFKIFRSGITEPVKKESEEKKLIIEESDEFVCDCGFKAKSLFGLKIHKKKHK